MTSRIPFKVAGELRYYTVANQQLAQVFTYRDTLNYFKNSAAYLKGQDLSFFQPTESVEAQTARLQKSWAALPHDSRELIRVLLEVASLFWTEF